MFLDLLHAKSLFVHHRAPSFLIELGNSEKDPPAALTQSIQTKSNKKPNLLQGNMILF